MDAIKMPYGNITMAQRVGDFSTLASLQSALSALGDSMLDGEIRNISFSCSVSPFYDSASTPPSGETYGTIYRASSGRYCVETKNPLSSNISPVLMWKWTGGWAMKKYTITT